MIALVKTDVYFIVFSRIHLFWKILFRFTFVSFYFVSDIYGKRRNWKLWTKDSGVDHCHDSPNGGENGGNVGRTDVGGVDTTTWFVGAGIRATTWFVGASVHGTALEDALPPQSECRWATTGGSVPNKCTNTVGQWNLFLCKKAWWEKLRLKAISKYSGKPWKKHTSLPVQHETIPNKEYPSYCFLIVGLETSDRQLFVLFRNSSSQSSEDHIAVTRCCCSCCDVWESNRYSGKQAVTSG